MARIIAQRDPRNQNAHIIDAVVAGTTFVVTRRGEPVAELRPLPRGRQQFVPKAELVALFQAGPSLDGAVFRRDLDAAFDQDLPDADA